MPGAPAPERPWAGSKVSRYPPANVRTRHPDFAAAESEVSIIIRKLSFAVPGALAAFALIILSGVPLPYAAHAQSSPSVALGLSSDTSEEGAAITVTMSFSGLESDSDTSDKDYIFRADVVDADGCEDRAGGYGLGVDRYMHKVDQAPEVRTERISARCPAGDYTVRASILSTDNVELASATASFTITAPSAPPTGEPCSGGGYDPTPTPVDVEAVPIVVESTAEEYFVLYVRHDMDGRVVEVPVSVTRGAAGTTTLAESVAALPKERYRVEKYLVARPGRRRRRLHRRHHRTRRPDRNEPGEPRRRHRTQQGAVAIPDHATFDTLAISGLIKFVMLGTDTDRPGVYFMNTMNYTSAVSLVICYMSWQGVTWLHEEALHRSSYSGATGATPDLISAGIGPARALAHARILLKADQGDQGPGMER